MNYYENVMTDIQITNPELFSLESTDIKLRSVSKIKATWKKKELQNVYVY